MEENFNELDDFDLEQDTDNYYYDDEDSFDSDYDYYEYNQEEDANQDDDDIYIYDDAQADEYNYEEYEKKTKKDVRSIIFKILIILLIIIVIICFGHSISSHKKKIKDDELIVVKNNKVNISNMTKKLKSAALKYFKEEQLPKNGKKVVTLQELEKKGYIDSVDSAYNVKKTKAILKTGEEGYQLILELFTNKNIKTQTYIVDHYEYCEDSYLCEKKDILVDDSNKEEQVINQPEQKQEIIKKEEPKNNNVYEWSKWSNEEITSCDTLDYTCNYNDINCRKEVKVFKRYEKVGVQTKTYKTVRNAFANSITETKNVCSLYDYVKVNDQYYRINSGAKYKMIGAIKKELQSNYYEWVYQGRVSYPYAPSDSINIRYVFVDADYTKCGNTCDTNPNYYYDKYQYNSLLLLVTNPEKDCSTVVTKKIPAFVIKSQTITTVRDEDVYNTVCYKSIRTR